MEKSKTPLWKRSMLKKLNIIEIQEHLYEMAENGDMYGYEDTSVEGYYNEYKDFFDEISGMAYNLLQVLDDYDISENWDDMTVTLMGNYERVLGYDVAEKDYFRMIFDFEEDMAVEEAEGRIMRLTKKEMLKLFRTVINTLMAFYDIKTAHDCLCSIVEELDAKGAILEKKNDEINRIYEDYTNLDSSKLDEAVAGISPKSRIWVE